MEDEIVTLREDVSVREDPVIEASAREVSEAGSINIKGASHSRSMGNSDALAKGSWQGSITATEAGLKEAKDDIQRHLYGDRMKRLQEREDEMEARVQAFKVAERERELGAGIELAFLVACSAH